MPGGEDEEVGADEEHDEPLDDEGQVARELGLEDLRIEVALERPGEEGAEEESREADADAVFRPSSATAIPRNPIVDDLDRARCDPELPAEDVHRAADAREGPGDRHREEVAPRDADPAVASRIGVEARPRGPRIPASSC